MFSELKTESKDEALRFFGEHLDHEYINVTAWFSDGRYIISVSSGHEPPLPDSY